MNKLCSVCGKEFFKKKSESLAYWATKSFCSHRCASDFKKGVSTEWTKGKQSDEHKKNLSKALKGRVSPMRGKKGKPHSEEFKKLMSERWKGNQINKGRKASEETRKKLSDYHTAHPVRAGLGKKQSLEHRIKNGLGNKGEKHWNWKGGRYKSDRKQDMNSIPYREWRKAVYARDNYTCQICSERGGKLHADHIKPYSTHQYLRYDVNNGRTLCEDCHRKTDTFGRKALKYKKAA